MCGSFPGLLIGRTAVHSGKDPAFVAYDQFPSTGILQPLSRGEVRCGSFSSDRDAPDAHGMSASPSKRTCETYLVCRDLIERPSLLRTRLIEKIEHALGVLHTHWRGDVLELERLLEREIEPLHLGELQRRLRVEFVARPLRQCARDLGHLRVGVNGAVIRIGPVDRAGEHLYEASDGVAPLLQ